MPKPALAITMGDPGGIGPEVILKTLTAPDFKLTRPVLIFGSWLPFQTAQKNARLSLECCLVPTPAFNQKCKTGIYFVDITAQALARYSKQRLPIKAGFDPGKITFRNAALAMESLFQGTRACLEGHAQALVTAPLNKTAMRFIDPQFHGHTEYLVEASKAKKYAMMFVGSKLKVTLVTIHEPIRKVASLITQERVFEKILLTHQFLKSRFRIQNPSIAVCALNPHGKETGTEDESEIRPAVKKAIQKRMKVAGPFSADQLFFEAYQGRYDALISMYHDQALAPFKMISFQDGVNVTLGLPFVRTSPDHGTAMDIAYQNQAEASSFASAFRLAEKLTSKLQ